MRKTYDWTPAKLSMLCRRKKLGLTQAALAERLGVSRKTLSAKLDEMGLTQKHASGPKVPAGRKRTRRNHRISDYPGVDWSQPAWAIAGEIGVRVCFVRTMQSAWCRVQQAVPAWLYLLSMDAAPDTVPSNEETNQHRDACRPGSQG